MVWTDALEKGVEFRSMVEVFQVTEFVKHDVVAKILWEAHEVQVEIDVSQF